MFPLCFFTSHMEKTQLFIECLLQVLTWSVQRLQQNIHRPTGRTGGIRRFYVTGRTSRHWNWGLKTTHQRHMFIHHLSRHDVFFSPHAKWDKRGFIRGDDDGLGSGNRNLPVKRTTIPCEATKKIRLRHTLWLLQFVKSFFVTCRAWSRHRPTGSPFRPNA